MVSEFIYDGPPDTAIESIREAHKYLGSVQEVPSLFAISTFDIEDGLLERLAGFGDVSQKNHPLCDSIFRAVKELSPFNLVMSLPGSSLESWKIRAGIKDKEFYIRTFKNYGLLIVVERDDSAEQEVLDRLTLARLRRAFQDHRNGINWSKRLQDMKNDFESIYDQVPGVLDAPLVQGFSDFCLTVATVDQFGKRPLGDIQKTIIREQASYTDDRMKEILEAFIEGSYGLQLKLNLAENPKEAAQLYFYLRAYYLLRDCGRWLGDGVFPWAKSLTEPHPSVNGDAPQQKTPFRALFIDENLGVTDDSDMPHRIKEAKRLRSRIAECFVRLFGREDQDFEIFAVIDSDGILPTLDEDKRIGDSVVDIDEYLEKIFTKRIKKISGVRLIRQKDSRESGSYDWEFKEAKDDDESITLHEYDAVFCEIDYQQRFAGAQNVQRLASYLERTRPPAKDYQEPALIVLTNVDNIGQVQQCLNLGAQAFVNKERLYQIPSRLKRAIDDVRTKLADGSALRSKERFGHHANFRALYSLRPDRVARLRHTKVQGGWPESPTSDRFRDLFERDALDRAWIEALPKADLHCHFGTSISLPTIEACALNTCGYLFEDVIQKEGKRDIKLLNSQNKKAIQDICTIVVSAAFKNSDASRKKQNGFQSAADYYHQAMREMYVADPDVSKEISDNIPDKTPNNPFDEIVRTIVNARNIPIEKYYITSLLVAAGTILKNNDGILHDKIEKWNYFKELHDESGDMFDPIKKSDSEKERDKKKSNKWKRRYFLEAARLGAEALAITRRATIQNISNHRSDGSVFDRLRVGGHYLETAAHLGEFWGEWHDAILERISCTMECLEQFINVAITDTELAYQDKPDRLRDAAFDLEDLVSLPERPSGSDRSLLRYLWGCGLLGAEHLQYPENIMLAAHDLVDQNAKDNVVYTEIRCETPGYTQAGMTSELATNLLCASLDLAAIHARSDKTETYVRSNILLAAKRHKPREDVESVISLLIRYLTRSPRSYPTESYKDVPAWWQPCRVVGFDLSGDESKSPNFLKEQITRLSKHSSPTTIHAGEAESAESVWQAVYEYNSRRIGHGLRLRDREDLLKFCINEGICMEMCPVSNFFTGDFLLVDNEEDYKPDLIEHYPLRYFMECGLDVCINTDNRSLHKDYGRTLTDEYLWAAKLSGSLTRWDVLKLIKSGFKHAFLDKKDVQELLQAVENWTYSRVAHAPGLDWQPGDSPQSATDDTDQER